MDTVTDKPPFAIVHFFVDDTVEVVSSSWIVDKENCWWPPCSTRKDLKDVTKEHRVIPEDQSNLNGWNLFKGRIFKYYGIGFT